MEMTALNRLAIIWMAVCLSAYAAHKTRMTPVLFFFALGCLLVNVGWLPEHPEPFIEGLAEIGIIVIMFALGFEEDTSNFLDSVKKSAGITFFWRALTLSRGLLGRALLLPRYESGPANGVGG